MPHAKIGDTVKVHYTGKLADGMVFDTSEANDPLRFIIGNGDLIEGFENGVVGMTPGQKKTIFIPDNRAYGSYIKSLVAEVEKTAFPTDFNPEIGSQIQIQQPDKEIVTVTITEITETHITIDGNHPLAGRNLIYDLTLVEIE